MKLAEYDTGKSLWKGKKATMIRKVALVHALREAFPSTAAQADALAVEDSDEPADDPFAGGEDA